MDTVDKLLVALSAFDAIVAKCPVRNYGIDRRAYGPNDQCSACGSMANGNCGKEAYASHQFVDVVRGIAAEGLQ